MWTLFSRNYCHCSLLAHPAYAGYHFWGIASVIPLYHSSSTPNCKLHTLWLMPAPGQYQSVDDWTIVSLVLAGSRESAVHCRPTGADYNQLVPRWNRPSSKFRLHASSSPVHRWSMSINCLQIKKSRYLWAPSASHWDTRLPSRERERQAVNVVPQNQRRICAIPGRMIVFHHW